MKICPHCMRPADEIILCTDLQGKSQELCVDCLEKVVPLLPPGKDRAILVDFLRRRGRNVSFDNDTRYWSPVPRNVSKS